MWVTCRLVSLWKIVLFKYWHTVCVIRYSMEEFWTSSSMVYVCWWSRFKYKKTGSLEVTKYWISFKIKMSLQPRQKDVSIENFIKHQGILDEFTGKKKLRYSIFHLSLRIISKTFRFSYRLFHFMLDKSPPVAPYCIYEVFFCFY